MISGFFITYMGSAVGTSPGRLVETDADFNIIHEWPEDVEGTLNILGEQFSPHGLSIDWEKDILLTSDFVVPLSILKPSLEIQRANTLRLWTLSSRKIISTITIPNVSISSPVKCRMEADMAERRAEASRTSSSSPAIPKAPLSPRPCISAKSGLSTPSARTPTATKVSPNSSTTSAPRHAIPLLSSK